MSGPKLPDEFRPPVSTVRRWVDGVDPVLLDLFITDIQVDCACPFERYDADDCMSIAYLRGGEPLLFERPPADSWRIMVPIHNRPMRNDDIIRLLKFSTQFARPFPTENDIVIDRVVYEDEHFEYGLPDKWCTGIITVNLRGWGFFMFANNMERWPRVTQAATG